MDTERDYIKEYIGVNSEKIFNNSFSWPTFFFSILYFIYRKLYLYTLLYFVINAVIIVIFEYILNLNILSSILSILFSFIVAFKFKDLYLYKIKKDIKKAQEQNLDISMICKKKGGVNKVGLIIALVIYLGIYFYVSYEYVKDELKKLEDTSTKEVITLKYVVPNEFNSKYISDKYSSYEYIDELNECNFIIQEMNNTYESETSYLSNVYKAENINNINIDNKTWYYFDNQGSYIYALIYKAKLYTLNY